MRPAGPRPALRILAVDDEPDFLRVLEIILRESVPCELRAAHDGVEALEVLASWPADIVLVDLQMPRMGGRELLREIGLRHPDAAAVVLTAYGDEEVAVEALRELGAADYLPKTSLSPERLAEVLGRVDLERRATAVRRRGGFDVLRVDRDRAAHLVPAGELVADPGFERVQRFQEGLEIPLAEGTRTAVVDLRYLTALVPFAFRPAMAMRRQYREAGGDLWIASPSRDVAAVVEMFDEARNPAGVGLHLEADVAEALRALDARND
jgi:CheY-like chemotaxis protein